MSSSLSETLTGDNRLPPHDVRGGSDPRGGDLVSRLLAATPPYLYSFAPPNTFFFSEMLRSFVHAKQPLDNAANPTVCGPPNNPVTSAPGLGAPHHNRRPRKRSWRDQGPVKMPLGLLQPHAGLSPISSMNPTAPIAADKPLELTTHRSSMNQSSHPTQPPPPPPLAPPPPPTSSEDKRPSSPTPSSGNHPNPLVNLLPPCNPLPDSQLPNDLLLPPTQPLWYPPLYPLPGGHQQPYGFDPLHFFIDLRVSGHIFDRNKNGKDEPDEVKVKQSKHCSAFSVPQPRNQDRNGGRSLEELPRPAPNSTHYVMQNLSRIYDDVRTLHNRPSPKRSPSPSPSRKCAEDSNNNSRSSDDDESKPVVVDCEKTEEVQTGETNEKEMTEEEREAKRAKDLRALIGLELVVDYVNHNEDGSPKKRSRSPSEEDDGAAADVDADGSESLERSASSPASVCSRSRSRTPSPAPRVSSPVPPPPYVNHGPPTYHDFHHLPSVFLRERTDALNLQVRHH